MVDLWDGTEPLLKFNEQDPARLSALPPLHPLVLAIQAIAATVLPADVATVVRDAATQVLADLASAAQQAAISAALSITSANTLATAIATNTASGIAMTASQASQVAALASQNAAHQSELAAGLSAVNALASQLAALVSANASSASATASAGSAGASAASATSAQGYATTLAASIASFNKLWLGPHATDPVLDNSGAALQLGAQYENTSTTPTVIRIYTATGWQDQDQVGETASANAVLAATQAGLSQVAAAASAAAAVVSATNSGNSAGASAVSATASDTARAASVVAQGASATSAGASAGSATASGASATLAQNWATQLGTMVGGVDYSAKFYANASSASATASAGSAANAAATLASALTKANNLSDVANADTSRGNLVAARSGANSDILSLAGLTTPLSVPQGGMGLFTVTAHAVLLGAAAAAISLASPAAAGFVLVSNGSNVDPSFQSLGVLYGRNRIINGDCRVVTRAQVTLSGSQNAYAGPDRFGATLASTGGTFTQSVANITYNGVIKNAVTQTVNTVATDLTAGKYWSGFRQVIEGTNCFDLTGQPIAVSFIFNATVAGNYSLSLRTLGATGYSYTTTFAYAVGGTPQQIVVLAPAVPNAAQIPSSNAGGMELWIGAQNQGTNACPTISQNAWNTGGYIAAVGGVSWSLTVNNKIQATDIQLEPGTVATPFERIPYHLAVLLCQRYYLQIGTGSATEAVATGLVQSGTSVWGTVDLPVSMRTKTPTLITLNISATTANQVATGTSQSLAWQTNQKVLYQLNCSGATAWGVGQAALIYATNGYFALDCEL